MADELASYNLQLQQVEAALLGDPSNEDLIKLKGDLMEIITLQEHLVDTERREVEAQQIPAPNPLAQKRDWEVGDRVMAPLAYGHRVVAVVESVTAAGLAITYVSSGQKTIVDPANLTIAQHCPKPKEPKSYIFDREKKNTQGKEAKREWQEERERRRMKSQKKEMKRKELDTAKETEKHSWQKFNNKAAKKGLSGLKRVNASGSAKDTGARSELLVSSRANQFNFKSARGAMDSLF